MNLESRLDLLESELHAGARLEAFTACSLHGNATLASARQQTQEEKRVTPKKKIPYNQLISRALTTNPS